jgi:hypothetical protein
MKLGIVMTRHEEVLAVAFFMKEENGGILSIFFADRIFPVGLPCLVSEGHIIVHLQEGAGDIFSWHVIEERTLGVDVALEVIEECRLAHSQSLWSPGVHEVGQVLHFVPAHGLAEAAHVVEGEADGAHELFERGVVQPGAIRYQQVLPLELEDRLSWSLLLLSLLLLALARSPYRHLDFRFQ